MFQNSDRSEISQLGEWALKDQLAGMFTKKTHTNTLAGIGHNGVAIRSASHDEAMAMCNVLLTEGIHFHLSYTPLKHLGYKAVVKAVNALCGVNVLPQLIIVNLAISNRFSAEALEELFEGIRFACEDYQLDMEGITLESSQAGIVLSITAGGLAAAGSVVSRTSAGGNDLLCVSGDLGAACVGLHYLERERRIFSENPAVQPDLSGHDYVIERQLKPTARTAVVHSLKEAGVLPTAMASVANGLAAELISIGKLSNCGISIYEEKLPIDPIAYQDCINIGLEATMCALHGGDDFELLFAVKQADFEKVRRMEGISIVGHTTPDAGKWAMVSKQGNEYTLETPGLAKQ